MQRKRRGFGSRFALITCVLVGASCAGTPIIYPPTEDHAGVLRVVELMVTESCEDASESHPISQACMESGITLAEFRAGSFARGRIYCCGGSTEVRNTLLVFVPATVDARVGDVIEVRMGRAPSKDGAPGIVNTASRVRDPADDGRIPQWGVDGDWTGRSCRWVPENDSLWGRLLYCDWMPEEGWIEYDGFWGAWIKPIE
jgi:hypothetical protein